MTKTVDEAISDLTAEITSDEGALRKKKETVNTLCGVVGRPPAYVLDDQGSAVPTQIRPDQFYGQPLAASVRTILEMRRQANLGAASNNEVYDALMKGGFQFNTKSEDVARASLRNSLAKNVAVFHKLPNGRFGLLSWYPKAAKAAAGGSGEEEAEEEVEENTEAATTTTEVAA